MIPQSLADTRALAPGLDVERAADILWTMNHPNLWQLLFGERGWTPDQYDQWCPGILCTQLLNRTRSRSSMTDRNCCSA